MMTVVIFYYLKLVKRIDACVSEHPWTVWAVGRGPVSLYGKYHTLPPPPRVSRLLVKYLVSTRHHWADIFIARRQGPDGRKGSTMNSTATCSTWTRRGSVRLYFARDLPNDEKAATTPYRIGRRLGQQDHAFRPTPGRRCQACYWRIIEDSWKRQHHH